MVNTAIFLSDKLYFQLCLSIQNDRILMKLFCFARENVSYRELMTCVHVLLEGLLSLAHNIYIFLEYPQPLKTRALSFVKPTPKLLMIYLPCAIIITIAKYLPITCSHVVIAKHWAS